MHHVSPALALSLALLSALWISAPLHAQGGDEIEVIPTKEEVIEPKAVGVDEARVHELVQEALAKRERDTGFLVSANGIKLLISGGMEFNYLDRANERRASFPSDLRGREGSAFELERAWLTLDGLYFDSNDASDFMIGQSRLTLEWEEDAFRIGEAWLMLHRPITRFNAPFFIKDFMSDGLLLGLARPVWHNSYRFGSSRSLLDEALSDDEEIQLTWSASSRWLYLFGGVSAGTVLQFDGDDQAALNDDILRDDRSLFFEHNDEDAFVTRHLSAHAGLGITLDLTKKGEVIPRKRAFFPWQVQEQDDVLHIGIWGSYDTMSPVESALVNTALPASEGQSRKFRLGVNADLIVNVGTSMLWRTRLSAALAKDAGLHRTFLSAESGLTFLFDDYFPALTYATPYMRLSSLGTNQTGPVLNGNEAVGSDEVSGAILAAERWRFSTGLRLGFHRHIALVADYTLNHEAFQLAAGEEDSENDVFTLSLQIGF